MSLYNVEAIVIRVRNFMEADKIAVLLTREEGKIEAVARGARRPRNRYAGAVQLFTHLDASLFRSRSLDSFSQVEIRESFRQLREDLERMAYGSYACELMDEIIRERQKSEDAFLLLLTTLHLLNTPDMDPESVLRAYELKLMAISGFCPQLQACVACGCRMGSETHVRFAPAMGGVLCPTCPSESGRVTRLSRGTLEVMKRLLEGDIRKASVVRIIGETRAELDRAMTAYIAERVERRLKSKEFLDTLRG